MPNFPVHNFGMDKMLEGVQGGLGAYVKGRTTAFTQEQEKAEKEQERRFQLATKIFPLVFDEKNPYPVRKQAAEMAKKIYSEKGINIDIDVNSMLDASEVSKNLENAYLTKMAEFVDANDWVGVQKIITQYKTDPNVSNKNEAFKAYEQTARTWREEKMKGVLKAEVTNQPVSPQELANIKAKAEANRSPSISDFGTFYAGQKKDYPNITDTEISKKWHEQKVAESTKVIVAGAKERGAAFANERFYPMFDTEVGKTIRVKGNQINSDTGNRYLDPQDPTVKAEGGSLAKITKSMDSVAAFDAGASQALDYSQTVAKDFGLGKYPGVNKVSQLFSYHLGDPKVKGLKNSITTAATEYMKVINAGSDLTATELSVLGQRRAKEIIESSDSLESLKNSIVIMKNEMKISSDKFKTQRTEIQNRLRGIGTTEPSPIQQTPAVENNLGQPRFKILKKY